MRLYVLGNGDVFAKKRKNTCFVLETDKKYMIDCPKEFCRTMEQNKINTHDIEGIILTHTHPDHYGDLETCIYQRVFKNYEGQNYNEFLANYVENGDKLKMFTSREIFESLRKKMDSVGVSLASRSNFEKLNLEDFLDFVELSPQKSYKTEKGMEIFVRDNDADKQFHHVPTIGLKIEYNDLCMSYSGDVEYDEKKINEFRKNEKISEKQWNDLLEFLWAPKLPDLIIHEASLSYNPGHTHIKYLENLPGHIKLRMYLAHVPDNMSSVLPILEEGKVYDLFKGGAVAQDDG